MIDVRTDCTTTYVDLREWRWRERSLKAGGSDPEGENKASRPCEHPCPSLPIRPLRTTRVGGIAGMSRLDPSGRPGPKTHSAYTQHNPLFEGAGDSTVATCCDPTTYGDCQGWQRRLGMRPPPGAPPRRSACPRWYLRPGAFMRKQWGGKADRGKDVLDSQRATAEAPAAEFLREGGLTEEVQDRTGADRRIHPSSHSA